tara:strand:+ start:121 stop:321 length:201 start_codon:yes stop_codon:yes gene_type:complete
VLTDDASFIDPEGGIASDLLPSGEILSIEQVLLTGAASTKQRDAKQREYTQQLSQSSCIDHEIKGT